MLAKTHQRPAHNDRAKVGRKSTRELPDVDQEHAQLQDRPPPEFLAPGCPQLTSEAVQDQVHALPDACRLLADAEVLGQRRHRVGEDGRVEVHRYLDAGDDAQEAPFLPPRPGVRQLVVAVVLCQLLLAVRDCRAALLREPGEGAVPVVRLRVRLVGIGLRALLCFGVIAGDLQVALFFVVFSLCSAVRSLGDVEGRLLVGLGVQFRLLLALGRVLSCDHVDSDAATTKTDRSLFGN